MDGGAYHSKRNGPDNPLTPHVLVLDRSRVFAEGAVILLAAAGMTARAADPETGVDSSQADPFTVIVADELCAPRSTGGLLDRLLALHPTTPLVLVVETPGQAADEAVAKTGATAWVSRHSEPDALIGTIRGLHGRRELLRPTTPAPAGSHISADRSVQLTNREQNILTLLSKGLSNEAIGRSLEISASTVRTHVRNVLVKLNVRSRTEAVAMSLHSDGFKGSGGTVERAVS